MELETHSPQQPAKRKTWMMFVIGGALTLGVCLCIAVAAAAVKIILPAMTATDEYISYNGIANEQLKSDTLNLIAQYEQAQNGCKDVMLLAGNLMLRPEQTADGSWSEIWQVNACGKSHLYKIEFTPDGVGGTYFSVSLIDQ